METKNIKRHGGVEVIAVAGRYTGIQLPSSFLFRAGRWWLRGPSPVSPCEAVMADVSGQFVGHTACQRLAGVHQLSSLDPSCRPQTVTLPRTDKTLQLRCHSRFLPPREPGSVYIRYGSRRCVVTSRARTHPPAWIFLVHFFNFFFFLEDSFHNISGHISRTERSKKFNSFSFLSSHYK